MSAPCPVCGQAGYDEPHGCPGPHRTGCACNKRDRRGCFLISARTSRCVACSCNTTTATVAKPEVKQ